MKQKEIEHFLHCENEHLGSWESLGRVHFSSEMPWPHAGSLYWEHMPG